MMREFILATVIGLAAVTHASAACLKAEGELMLVPEDENAPHGFVSLEKPPISAPFNLAVRFCGTDGNEVTEMTFDAMMPAHQHGMNYVAEVTSLGEQSFSVSNVVFHMPGLWELRIEASAAGDKAKYTAEVQVE